MGDFRYAFRQLRKAPGFTVTAVLTLALGIGANTAIFSLVDSILLRPLPFPQQAQLMRIGYEEGSLNTSFFPKGWLRALGEHTSSFEAISGFGPDVEANLGDGNAAVRAFGSEVMANAFDILGIRPAVGHFFSSGDATAGGNPVVVLSYGYWREHYAMNADLIGQTVRVDGVPRRVIGVLPASVHFPYADTQFVTPVLFKGGDPFDPWRQFNLRAFARLNANVTPLQAQAELRRVQRPLLPTFPWQMPENWAAKATVTPLLESEVGSMGSRLMLLFATVGLILVIACANVANLMLARAAGREREIAVRGALGASATRLVRQLLCESLVLGALAGIVGTVLATVSVQVLVTLLPVDTPRMNEVSLQWPMFVFAAAASAITGLVFGLIPALRMASPHLHDSLLASSRSVAGKAGRFRLSMLLVVGQIALSVVVITVAGLMLHSLHRLLQVDPGFRPERVVTAEISLDADACKTRGRCEAFFSALLDRVRGIPGTESIALTDSLPIRAQIGDFVYDAEGHPRAPLQTALIATRRIVSPGYISTLGIRLIHGRLLNDQDTSGASHAAIISQNMAQRLWSNEDPVGKHILQVSDELRPTQWNESKAAIVVGVVSNTHEGSLAADFEDEVYLPMTPDHEQSSMFVLLRTHESTSTVAEALRQTLALIDAQAPITRVQTLNEVVATSASTPRSLSTILLLFGLLAVIIGGVGVYSLIAYVVSWRTREFGIRLALGAQRWQIILGVLGQSLAVAFAGLAGGLTAAALLGQLVRRFLFGIDPLDPLTYGAVALLMTLLAAAAAWIPARRAAGVEPMMTLRME